MTSVLLAIAASLSWGVSDFLGGTATGSLPVTRVLVFSQAAGLLLITAFVLAHGDALPHGRHLLEALAAGVAAILALGLLYVALARGAAIIVAPLAATGAAIPVVVGFVHGDPVRAVNVAGIALAFAGVIATSIEPGDRGGEGGTLIILLALGAGAATGLYFTLIGLASAAGAPGTIEAVRISATITALAALTWATVRSRRVPSAASPPAPAARLLWAAVLAVGVTDALAEISYAGASAAGHLSVVSVLAGSYPAVTVLLAVAVLRQRAHPVQTVGAAGTIAGILLLAAGSG